MSEPERLKTTQVKPLREELLAQDPICSLCEREITDPALDHCHKTGYVRNVLCRWCNSILGKIENNANRVGRDVDSMMFLTNCLDYLKQNYSSNPIHPSQGKPKKRRKKKSRKSSTIDESQGR